MNPETTHIIQRQTVRLHLRAQADSWAVQERVGRTLQQSGLLSALDAVLSELSSAEEWIELGRVDVDLGIVSVDNLESEIARRLPEMLRRQLIEAIPETRFQQPTAVRNTEEVVFDTFLNFLQTGLLPETTRWPESHQAFEKQIQLAIKLLSNLQKKRLETVLADPKVRSRVLNQFSEETLEVIFNALKISPEPLSIRLLNRLQTWREKLPTSQYAVLLKMLLEKTVLETEIVLQVIEDRWSGIETTSFESNLVLESLLKGFEMPVLGFTEPDSKADLSTSEVNDQPDQVRNKPTSDTHSPSDESGQAGFQSEQKRKNSATSKIQSTTGTDLPADPVFYARNAGVVLLHPFLTVCFEACGWIEKAVFKDDECRERALLMVHFLATGEPKAAEYDLLLPKLLCETPWNAPVFGQMTLTEKEQEEGIGLLNAAIGHWGALKNTSPDGLRDGFLKRDGKLVPLPDGRWELTVESKAQDVLLSRLPPGWGLSMVQLPWMKKRLTCNWG